MISNNLARCRKKLQLECETLEKCKKRELNKVKGDLITANIYRINKGDKKAVLENFYDGGKIIEIALDETLTPSQNAQKYYKKIQQGENRRGGNACSEKNSTRRKSTISKRFCSIWKNVETKEEIAQIKEELVEHEYLKKRNIKREKRNRLR
ncbi:MAG: NFACT family protein [Clostridiales bacterium]|nr:MAG: NFACT family protein [Clostridiales bacterium]